MLNTQRRIVNRHHHDALEGDKRSPSHSETLTARRAKLAHAVTSEPRAALIPPDNRKFSGWLPLKEAIARDECFAVKIKDDILALDCDQPSSAESVWAISDLLADFGITSVVVQSGGPDRLHLFAWVPDSRLLATVTRRARQAKVDVRTGRYMRPPLTRHRVNHEVRLLEPSHLGAAVNALMTVPADLADRVDATRLLDEDAPTPQTLRTTRRLMDVSERLPISDRMSRLLRDGDIGGQYSSNSEIVQAITTEAARCGWSLDEVFDVLADPQNVGGQRLRQEIDRYGHERAHDWLEHGYHKAEKYLDAVRAVSADRLAYWSRYATRGLTGLTATSDRAVLQALLDVAKRAGRLSINASHRELTEMSGLARGTVRDSLKRLEAKTLFQVADQLRSPTDALTYDLDPEALDALADSVDPPSTHPEYPAVSLAVVGALGHDLWRNKSGLGKGPGLTWQALTDTPQSVAMLAQARGVRADTIRRHLRVLRDCGLAGATREGWVRHNNRPEYLDSLAKSMASWGAEWHRSRSMLQRGPPSPSDSSRAGDGTYERRRGTVDPPIPIDPWSKGCVEGGSSHPETAQTPLASVPWSIASSPWCCGRLVRSRSHTLLGLPPAVITACLSFCGVAWEFHSGP